MNVIAMLCSRFATFFENAFVRRVKRRFCMLLKLRSLPTHVTSARLPPRGMDVRRGRLPDAVGRTGNAKAIAHLRRRPDGSTGLAYRLGSTDPMQPSAASVVALSLGLVACGGSHSTATLSKDAGDRSLQAQEGG